MTPNLVDYLSAEVRAELARQSVPRRRLAEALGISTAALSTRLAGKVAFDVRELEIVARELGVPVTRFLPDAAPEPAGGTR